MKHVSLAFSCVCAFLAVPLIVTGTALPVAADGIENPRRSPHLDVRERANYRDPLASYWEGFELKNEGDCEAAVERLKPLAMNGRGFESAQHAFGLCLMSLGGLPSERGAAINVENIASSSSFQDGKAWILRAAQAGNFQAQRTLLSLYAVNLGPDNNPVEIGKWLRLYDVNPLRLTLGVIEQSDGLQQHLNSSITLAERLDGKELARNWTPTYWAPPGVHHTH